MLIVDAEKVEGIAIPGPFHRTIKVLLAPDTQREIKDLSITMAILDPGVGNDLHSHPVYELQYVLAGYGRIVVGGQSCLVKPGTLVVAPPKILHQVTNESDEVMKILCIWNPAVPGTYVTERALAAARPGVCP